MKVYAKFRIDIDKEDESIYTQKAVNLMQKLEQLQQKKSNHKMPSTTLKHEESL